MIKPMEESWLENYLSLALRMDRAFQNIDTSYFLDTYYGPPHLKEIVFAEPIWAFAQLADFSRKLMDDPRLQDFDGMRSSYLLKHVLAMETIARVRAGEEMPFFKLVQEVLDLEPVWIEDEEFERALDLLDQALPGSGDVRIRFQSWQKKALLSSEHAEQVLPLMHMMLDEARIRTRRIVDLPSEESLELSPVRGVNYGAANWYLGNFRSRLELNLDRPIYLFTLLYQMCHEAYPGHHTESSMKELYLYRKKGYLEQSVFFALGPQLTIAEGIASLAMEMIFTPQEAADWIHEHITPLLSPEAGELDLVLLLKAFSMISPDDLSSNLAQLLEAGRSIDRVIEYAHAYSPYSEEQIRGILPWLASPLARLYSFTYSHGKRIIQPILRSPNREKIIRMLLTEQITPSLLISRFNVNSSQ
jgi:hypothetical protein